MSNLKVYGGLLFVGGRQVRVIVAAKTKKRAAELVSVPVHQFYGWWTETANETECDVALAKPETVFYASSCCGKDFKERE